MAVFPHSKVLDLQSEFPAGITQGRVSGELGDAIASWAESALGADVEFYGALNFRAVSPTSTDDIWVQSAVKPTPVGSSWTPKFYIGKKAPTGDDIYPVNVAVTFEEPKFGANDAAGLGEWYGLVVNPSVNRSVSASAYNFYSGTTRYIIPIAPDTHFPTTGDIQISAWYGNLSGFGGVRGPQQVTIPMVNGVPQNTVVSADDETGTIVWNSSISSGGKLKVEKVLGVPSDVRVSDTVNSFIVAPVPIASMPSVEVDSVDDIGTDFYNDCLLYTSPSPRD